MNKFFANKIDIPTIEIPRRIFDAKPISTFSNIGERSSKMRNVMLKKISLNITFALVKKD